MPSEKRHIQFNDVRGTVIATGSIERFVLPINEGTFTYLSYWKYEADNTSTRHKLVYDSEDDAHDDYQRLVALLVAPDAK